MVFQFGTNRTSIKGEGGGIVYDSYGFFVVGSDSGRIWIRGSLGEPDPGTIFRILHC